MQPSNWLKKRLYVEGYNLGMARGLLCAVLGGSLISLGLYMLSNRKEKENNNDKES